MSNKDTPIQTFVNNVTSSIPFNQGQIRKIKFTSCINKDSKDFLLDVKTGFVTFVGKPNTKCKVLFQFGLTSKVQDTEIYSFVNVNDLQTIPCSASIVVSLLSPNIKQQIVLNDTLVLKKKDIISLGGLLKSGSTQALEYSNVYVEFIAIP